MLPPVIIQQLVLAPIYAQSASYKIITNQTELQITSAGTNGDLFITKHFFSH
jgi:hypothetical protein